MANAYWLCKTEPGTYSFEQLLKDRRTNWNDVRNFQARNHLRAMSVGDRVLIYHSGTDKAVIGTAEVCKAAYPDPDDDGKDWVQVDLKADRPFKHPVPLATLKADSKLKGLPMLRQSQLSVMPVTRAEFEHLVRLGEGK